MEKCRYIRVDGKEPMYTKDGCLLLTSTF